MMKFARIATPARPAALASFALAAIGASTPILCAADESRMFPPSHESASAAKVLEAYLIAPKAASELECQVLWQTITPLREGVKLTMVDSAPDAVLALNSRNALTMVRTETGDRAWTTSAAEPLDQVIGLGVFPYVGLEDNLRIGIMTDAVFYTLSFDSGATLARSQYRNVPSTKPAHVGRWFIYGTNGGRVAWLNAATGTDSRSHLADAIGGPSPITAKPVVESGVVVAADRKGSVIALGAASGDLRWKRNLLAGVSASPSAGSGLAFVASEDQYLYAFDLATGSTRWRYFTQTPLATSPFPAGELVLQDVPGEGLVALTQNPESQPGGEVRWKRERVMGIPLTVVKGAVAFWCEKCRKVTMISLKDGSTIREVSLPAVEHLEADTIEAGGFVAWSSDGRIERLSPIANATAAK